TSLMQTLEIRRALEAEAAALCAVRAGQAEIAEIARKLDIMEQAFHTRAGMSAEEDWEFHQSIYRASGNPLFEQIIAAMHELFHRFWEHPLGVRDFGHASFPYHRTIYERIAAHDPEGARAEALKLIATVEDDLKR
ncbi:MAG: FadR family transcriptional regulator, partial [Mesorhizobium sp.]